VEGVQDPTAVCSIEVEDPPREVTLVPLDLSDAQQRFACAFLAEKLDALTPAKSLRSHGLLQLRLAEHALKLGWWHDEVWLH
jgi:hypothetical protein